MNITIDRFEGEFAICEVEAGIFADIPKLVLPSEAKEGDILLITIDPEETEARKKRIGGLMKDLFVD